MKRVIPLILLCLLLCSCGKKEEVLYCDKGELINNKCVVKETKEVIKKCPEGFKYSKETKKCNSDFIIPAKKVSKCPNGYDIGNDNWCYSDEEYDMVEKKECISDKIKEDDKYSSTYVKDDKCILKLCIKVDEKNKKCSEFKETTIDFTVSDVCPGKNMKKVEGKCRKKYWMNKKYSCEVGELDGTKCIIKDTKDMVVSCPEGFKLSKDKLSCIKEIVSEPLIK